jgi:hypothetical protein
MGPSVIRIEYKNGKKFLRPITDPTNVIELSYYSNCVLPIYALEAVVGELRRISLYNYFISCNVN